jgi:hypothetical protein
LSRPRRQRLTLLATLALGPARALGLTLAVGLTLPATAAAAKTAPKPVPVAPNAATVTVTGASERVIPAGFLGLSLENTAILPYAGTEPKKLDPVFLQLVRNLTPDQSPVLRIGGDSTDWAWYPVPGLTKPSGVRVTLTPRWVAVMHALASELNARLIMGIDLEADSRATAEGEANAFEHGIGKHWIEALELGNEPELYGTFTWYVAPNGVHVMGRPPGYDFRSYLNDFSAFASVLPGPLAGPADGSASWMADTAQFLVAEPRVQVLTMHAYPVQTCFVGPSSPQYPTVAHLLAPAATTGLADVFGPYAALAHSHHLPLRIDEINTDSCGDAPGVSNAFVSALWALDTLFELARVGVDGVNMHTYPQATYQLFTFAHSGRHWSAAVAPEYYGLEMFAQATPPGSRLITTTTTNGQGVIVWATRGADHRTRVVLINESANRLPIALGATGSAPATLERLRAPGLTSTGGVTLGGQSFGARTTTGLLAGRPSIARLTAGAGHYVFALPANSAALVTY